MMDVDCMPLQETGLLSALIHDYLNQKNPQLYNLSTNWDNLYQLAKEKQKQYSHRDLIVKTLKKQNPNRTKKQEENLKNLSKNNAFTITTGHQLNLFGGPMYLIYKILEVIKICEKANQQDQYTFVPIFWMASEDHDFKEVNHFWHANHKLNWSKKAKGAVGRLDTQGLDSVLNQFLDLLPSSKRKEEIKQILDNSLVKNNYAQCFKNVVNQLFAQKGLLILDADCKELKQTMIPYFKEELLYQTAHLKINETNVYLKQKQYKVQVNPRKINLFYLDHNLRERIIKDNASFAVLNTNLRFSQEEILLELEKNPEKFSPNVVMRPLFQEVILPNVAYVGGSGETAYWLQLKSFFQSQNVQFPLLVLRNSFKIQSQKQKEKQEKLGLSNKDAFLSKQASIQKVIEKESKLSIDFDAYHKQIEHIFYQIKHQSQKTHISFGQMALAQEQKQLKGLQKMQKRMLKAETKQHQNLKNRVDLWYENSFPNGQMQERNQNFTTFYMAFGIDFLDKIYEKIQPMESDFYTITIPN